MSSYLQRPPSSTPQRGSVPRIADADRKTRDAIERRQRREQLARKIAEAQPLKRNR